MILNWNGWRDTLECLRTIADTLDSPRVWLVDNGSHSDRTRDALAVYPPLRVLRWQENHGFAGGYNRALRLAAREGIAHAYLLNNDCRAVPGFLEGALTHALADPQLAAVGSCICYTASPEHVIFDGAYHHPGTRRFRPFELCEVSDVNGAGMLVRVGALEQSGYFDERFFCYGEETEWCWRMIDAGWKIAVTGKSVVLHRRQGSDVSQNAAYYRTRNQYLLLDRLSPSRRLFWTFRLTARSATALYGAHRAGRRAQAQAIAAAVKDAALKRYGKRTTASSSPLLRLLLVWGAMARMIPTGGKPDSLEPKGFQPTAERSGE